VMRKGKRGGDCWTAAERAKGRNVERVSLRASPLLRLIDIYQDGIVNLFVFVVPVMVQYGHTQDPGVPNGGVTGGRSERGMRNANVSRH